MESTHSSKRTLHVLRRASTGDLEIRPGYGTRRISFLFLGLSPIAFALSWHFRLPVGIRAGALIFPLFGACAYGIMHILNARYGMRARFSSKSGRVVICKRQPFGDDINDTVPFQETASIQLVFVRTITTQYQERRSDGPGCKDRGDSWNSYCLNLVLKDKTLKQLLESGDKKNLQTMGESIARYMRIPFELNDHNDY